MELKDKRISNYELDRKLTEAYTLLLELKNEDLVSCKNYYNKNTSELNKIIQKIPTNIVAKINRCRIKPFFDGKNMQDAVTDDFKL